MVLFGELVIPSSRVLWDDEDEYTQIENTSAPLEWKGDSTVPTDISNILIIETSKLNNIAVSCLENENKPSCYLAETNVKVYKLKNSNYLILCSELKNQIPGVVTEMITPWLQNAKRIVCITSNAKAMFQNNRSEEMPPCFIRALSTDVGIGILAPVLDVPNLVTGVSAGVMSYCQHVNKSAVLYICYTDPRPLDSISASPILDLLKNINIPTDKPFAFKPVFKSDSNLYM